MQFVSWKGRVQYTLYAAVTSLLRPLIPLGLAWRTSVGLEDINRVNERYGHKRDPATQFDGQLDSNTPTYAVSRLNSGRVWLHGASTGELLSLLPLARYIQLERCILTCGTVSGVNHPAIPQEAVVQYAPLDVPSFVSRVIDEYDVRACIIAESELWPNTIQTVRNHGIPMALVNARMGTSSQARWRSWAPDLLASMLSSFQVILSQERAGVPLFQALGASHVQHRGNLKACPNPDYGQEVVTGPNSPLFHSSSSDGRAWGCNTWLASCTHTGEDEIILDVHQELVRRKGAKGKAGGGSPVLTVIAPRHPHRAGSIASMSRQRGFHTIVYSERDQGLDIVALSKDTVYIVDSLGVLPSLYHVAPIVLLGGSLCPPWQGHNPFEPCRQRCITLHGPHVDSFTEVYSSLTDHMQLWNHVGSRPVGDAVGIATIVDDLFSSSTESKQLIADHMYQWAEDEGKEVLQSIWKVLQPLIPP